MITLIPEAGFTDENYIRDLADEIDKERIDPIEIDEEKLDHLEIEHGRATEDAAYEEAEQPKPQEKLPELA